MAAKHFSATSIAALSLYYTPIFRKKQLVEKSTGRTAASRNGR
jgi:hypothetical protein